MYETRAALFLILHVFRELGSLRGSSDNMGLGLVVARFRFKQLGGEGGVRLSPTDTFHGTISIGYRCTGQERLERDDSTDI